jgi:hypothetical protein
MARRLQPVQRHRRSGARSTTHSTASIHHRSQRPVDARAADAKLLGDVGRPHTLRLQFAHPGLVYRSRAALVDAGRLGLGDARVPPAAGFIDLKPSQVGRPP